jgi:DNA polymerase III subunit alpha
MTTEFTHLHLHSEYSLVDGIVRIGPMLKALKAQGASAVAMTDQANLFGMVKFYKAARKAGIKPIIGSEIWLHNADEPSKPFCLVLLCQNNAGYLNLSRLLSRAYVEGQHLGHAIIRPDWLEGATEGLIAMSAGLRGDIGSALSQNKPALAEKRLAFWQAHFPNRFYLELIRTGKPQQEAYNQAALDLAEKHDVPVVATNDVRFLQAADFEAHEARICIQNSWILTDSKRPRLYNEEQHLKSPADMCALFQDVPEAIENSLEIVKRCNVTLSLGESFLPDFPTPQGVSIKDYLEHVSQKGLEKRLNILYDTSRADFADIRKPYDERLAIELGVINQMGFPGYFLIVADFIQWAKDNGIPVGPGRGSGAGSLVAYALEITDLDPLAYELLFERFLNPERVSMPDFDIDFCMDGRDRVIDYVAEKYGRRSVSQIITFGTMAAKAVVRDVGRVLDHPYGFMDKIAKLIPFEIGITLEKALEEPELKKRYESEEDVRTVIDLAKKLEGVARNAGKHAGGVVISPGDLTDFSPIYCEAGTQNFVTQYDKDDVETVGLVKFDFLGLRTLTIIDWAVNNIHKRDPTQDRILIDRIPTDDKASFKLLKACDTTAVFQLESRGMKDLIGRLQPDHFEEIIALVALFRPGPLQSGMVDDFIDRKHGRAKVEYPHPALEPILKPTYGVILYQEQVMQIAQVLAGYSLGAADILRRAMGKKKIEEMEQQREIFTKGAVKNGVEEKTATYIFDLMEKFAGYGFNKSHSAAYALVAYQTAWLKTHYPAEFMAAVLSSDMDNTDKVLIFFEDCKHKKLTVLPPNINTGLYQFSVNKDSDIIYGLGAVKGAGEAALEEIINERDQNGEYKDLFDFCLRNDSRKVTKRVLEALIKSGSFDVFGHNRASLMASLSAALQAADQHLKNKAQNQNDLFSEHEDDTSSFAPTYHDIEEWPMSQKLVFEKDSVGFYLSGHPYDQHRAEISKFTSCSIKNLDKHMDTKVLFGGLIVGLRFLKTKRGKAMGIVSIDDNTSRVDIVLFSETLEDYRQYLIKDTTVIIEGEVSHDEFSGGVRVTCNRIYNLTMARNTFAKRLRIRLTHDADKHAIKTVSSILKSYTGGKCPVILQYLNAHGQVNLPLNQDWHISPATDLFDKLNQKLPDLELCLDYE